VLSEQSIILDVTPGDGASETRFLEVLGHPVLVCHGPEAATLCPILQGTSCAMVEQAHGIVFQVDLDRPQHRAILERYQEVIAEDIPLWVAVKPGQDKQYRDLLRGVQVVTGEPGAAQLDAIASQVEAADNTR
jgi:hypothetical protein